MVFTKLFIAAWNYRYFISTLQYFWLNFCHWSKTNLFNFVTLIYFSYVFLNWIWDCCTVPIVNHFYAFNKYLKFEVLANYQTTKTNFCLYQITINSTLHFLFIRFSSILFLNFYINLAYQLIDEFFVINTWESTGILDITHWIYYNHFVCFWFDLYFKNVYCSFTYIRHNLMGILVYQKNHTSFYFRY